MRLGWDEIKRRAKAFSEDWKDAHYEKGETQSFYNDFFEIFGVKRRQVATYEQRVKLLNNKHGFMDLFWPKTLLIEQKSARLDLNKAGVQAMDYIDGIRAEDQPRYVLTCDFQTWNLLDLETGRATNFALAELHRHIESFGFILGRRVSFGTQAIVNIKAAELMGKLHDALEDANYTGHDLEQLLVRLLFCLFADDTGIFEPKDIFLQLIEADTKEDGSDTGRMLIELFDVLNTQESKRQKGLSGELNAFPYVNGALFSGHIRTPVFDKKTREMLLDAARFDWGKVSPAIFGSLFQSVMSPKERRAKGAHYTTEANILKVIGPLFLDELKAEFEKISARKTGRAGLLQEFQHKLSRLTFLDPACGCGNFLVIAYRELRSLELAVLHELWDGQRVMDIAAFSLVTVDQFYGIEFEEFPARIAEVAMWMTDHIANNELSLAFGQSFARIPLKQSAKIIHGDALEIDWADLLPPEKCHYIMGNPPFLGKKEQSRSQKIQVRRLFEGVTGSGELDYVSCWFEKASAFAGGNARIRIAFVSTNSICQGEQVGTLWSRILLHHRMEIDFAHRTFEWNSEARGGAHVHVIIVGIAKAGMVRSRRIFEYQRQKGGPLETIARNINPYLVDGPNIFVTKLRDPISPRPKIQKGSEATDFGHLTISPTERSEFLKADGFQRDWLKEFIGGDEFIKDSKRYCLWLVDASPSDLRNCPIVLERIRRVTDARKASDKPRTKDWAAYPALFSENRQPSQKYLLVPKVSSQRREYVPMGFVDPEIIVSGSAQFVETADPYIFGVLTSAIHMVWMRAVGGRTKSDYQYTNTLVYNTFPWPQATPAQRTKIETLAKAVLDARAVHQPMSSLADLYDPDTMPGNLRKAHAALDTAVDRLYRTAPFASDRDRVEHLFGRYEALVNPMAREAVKQNKLIARKTG